MVQLSTPGVTPNRGMGAFCQITLTSCYCLFSTTTLGCLHGTAVERWSLTSELSVLRSIYS